jgi:hypothetical protein
VKEYTLFTHDYDDGGDRNAIVQHFLAKDDTHANQIGTIVYKHLGIDENMIVEGWHVPLVVTGILMRDQEAFVGLVKFVIPQIVTRDQLKSDNRLSVFLQVDLARLRDYIAWYNSVNV